MEGRWANMVHTLGCAAMMKRVGCIGVAWPGGKEKEDEKIENWLGLVLDRD